MSLLPPYKYGNCDCGCGGIDVQGRKVGKVFMCVSSYQRMKTLEQIEKQKKKNAARNTQTKLRSTLSITPDNRDKQREYYKLDLWFKEVKKVIEANPHCWNCGEYIPEKYYRHASAHIFAKSLFPSVSTHPMNF